MQRKDVSCPVPGQCGTPHSVSELRAAQGWKQGVLGEGLSSLLPEGYKQRLDTHLVGISASDQRNSGSLADAASFLISDHYGQRKDQMRQADLPAGSATQWFLRESHHSCPSHNMFFCNKPQLLRYARMFNKYSVFAYAVPSA